MAAVVERERGTRAGSLNWYRARDPSLAHTPLPQCMPSTRETPSLEGRGTRERVDRGGRPALTEGCASLLQQPSLPYTPSAGLNSSYRAPWAAPLPEKKLRSTLETPQPSLAPERTGTAIKSLAQLGRSAERWPRRPVGREGGISDVAEVAIDSLSYPPVALRSGDNGQSSSKPVHLCRLNCGIRVPELIYCQD